MRARKKKTNCEEQLGWLRSRLQHDGRRVCGEQRTAGSNDATVSACRLRWLRSSSFHSAYTLGCIHYILRPLCPSRSTHTGQVLHRAPCVRRLRIYDHCPLNGLRLCFIKNVEKSNDLLSSMVDELGTKSLSRVRGNRGSWEHDSWQRYVSSRTKPRRFI